MKSSVKRRQYPYIVTLFVPLQANREGLAPLIMEELRIVSEACPSGRSASVPGPGREGIPEAVLAKEAVYNAVGAGAWELLDHVDFTSWLHAALLPVRPSASTCPVSPRDVGFRVC